MPAARSAPSLRVPEGKHPSSPLSKCGTRVVCSALIELVSVSIHAPRDPQCNLLCMVCNAVTHSGK